MTLFIVRVLTRLGVVVLMLYIKKFDKLSNSRISMVPSGLNSGSFGATNEKFTFVLHVKSEGFNPLILTIQYFPMSFQANRYVSLELILILMLPSRPRFTYVLQTEELEFMVYREWAVGGSALASVTKYREVLLATLVTNVVVLMLNDSVNAKLSDERL